MKKAEAISILATSVRPREAKDSARYDKAVKMAIEALKSSERTAETAQNVSDSDLIFRKMAIEALRECQTYLFDECDPDKKIELRSAERAIEDLPSAQLGQRYTNEELMIFQHGISLSLLSKRSAQHWRYDENTATEIKFLERLYEKVSANMRGGQNE